MESIDIRELFRNTKEYADKEITVVGWIRNLRVSKNFAFMVINDGTFFEPLQVVLSDSLSNFDEVTKLNVGSAVIVKGKLIETPDAKQAFELQATEVAVEGASTSPYQYLPGGIPRSLPDRIRDPQVLPGA